MFKKLKWFLFYRKTIRKNRTKLLRNHGIKIDWVNRMYKTYTLSNDEIEESKLYGTSYIEKILEKDRLKIEETLLELKIHQFVGLMEIEPLNEKQIGVAFRYKHFDTAKIANILIWTMLVFVSMLIAYLLKQTLLSLIIGLLIIFGIYLLTRLFVVNRTAI